MLLGVAGAAALWIWVAQDLRGDPEAWVENERRFRHAIREVLLGSAEAAEGAPVLPPWPGPLPPAAERILLCAEAELARGVRFTPGYRRIGYPWGDLPPHLSTSVDLVIRCLRAIEIDLQQLVHLDRAAHAKRYPLHLWGPSAPDPSIDHRRLPILYAFLRFFLPELPLEIASPEQRAAFLPGDLVLWSAAGGDDHPGLSGIVTDRRDESGMPRCITVTADDPRVSDAYPLDKWPIRSHFRPDPDALLEAFLAENPKATLEPRPPGR
jgi:uncharacterized protein YijF (DUF1287 family)